MWHLQGILLYRSIEHRNEASAHRNIPGAEAFDDVYDRIIRDPRVDPEEAIRLAA
jgi:hypothetical protein